MDHISEWDSHISVSKHLETNPFVAPIMISSAINNEVNVISLDKILQFKHSLLEKK